MTTSAASLACSSLLVLVVIIVCGSTWAASESSCAVGMAKTSEDLSMTAGIPRVQDWPHRPVFLKASKETKILGFEEDGKILPLGVPFEFETPLFKGEMLVRLRNATSAGAESHDAYFAGRKRLMQTVVQGQFKQPVSMNNVFVGSVFKEPMRLVPPPAILRILQAIIRRTSPGVILDLASPQPKVMSLYAGSAQTISIDKPGLEPDIMATDLPENMNLIGKVFKSIKHRKNHLSCPKKAAQYQFDTEHVYTLHHFDDVMDYAKYTVKMPMYEYDLSKALGPQPMSLSAVTTFGEVMFHIDVWHERVYNMRFP